MARLGAEYTETFTLDAPVDVVRAHFASVDAVIAANTEAERATKVSDDTVRFDLKEQSHGPYTLSPYFVVTYRVEGDDVVWSSSEGSMTSEGRASFTAAGGATKVAYRHHIDLEIPLPKMVLRMLKPVVSKMVSANTKAYLSRLKAGLA